MITQRVPWLAIYPWAQVLGPDGHVWTVLPSHRAPDVQRLVRWPFTGPFAVAVNPYDLVTLLMPDEHEALMNLGRAFEAQTLAEHDAGKGWAPIGWRVPGHLDSELLRIHLRDMHNVSGLGLHGYRNDAEVAQHHFGLHQQVMIYPLPVPHFHDYGED